MKISFALPVSGFFLPLLSVVSLTSPGWALPRSILYADQGHSHHHATPDSGQMNQAVGEHEHGSIEVSAAQPLPDVELIVHPDARQGWNLEVQVTNFQFSPEDVNQPGSSTSEGHAHLYIDGVKITRLYGNWYYLESLAPGQHEVTVSLNTNSHETLTHNGQPIQATVVIEALNVP